MEGGGAGSRDSSPGTLSAGWGGPGYGGTAAADESESHDPGTLNLLEDELAAVKVELGKLHRGQVARDSSVRHFRWFVWGALVYAIIQAVTLFVLCYLVFSTVNYLDTARQRRDARDSIQEYVMCLDLADRASQRALNDTEMREYTYLRCDQALTLPAPPGGGPDAQPSPVPSPTGATPSPAPPPVTVVPTPAPATSSAALGAVPIVPGTTAAPVPGTTAAAPTPAPTTPAPTTPANPPASTPRPRPTTVVTVTPSCVVGLLGLCVLSEG